MRPRWRRRVDASAWGLQGVLTCGAKRRWWDLSKCSHRAGRPVLGAAWLSCAGVGSGGSAGVMVCASPRHAQYVSNGGDPAGVKRGGPRRNGRACWCGSVARGSTAAFRPWAYDGSGKGIRSDVLPVAEVGGIRSGSWAHVHLPAGGVRAGRVRGEVVVACGSARINRSLVRNPRRFDARSAPRTGARSPTGSRPARPRLLPSRPNAPAREGGEPSLARPRSSAPVGGPPGG